MPRPRPDALALGARYRISPPPAPRGGLAGERLGRGTGSSLEFEDRRTYVPGDDVRHLDWRAFARTDQLQVRVYREEIVPRLDLIVDATASMAIDEGKAQGGIDLAAFLVEAGQSSALDVRIVAVGERPEPIERERLAADGIACEGGRTLLELLPATLALVRPRASVIVVSDFLFPHAAADLVRPLRARGGPLLLLQVLGASDAAPEPGAARLTDAEDGSTLDLVLDARAVARYVERLERLRDELEHECRRGGATFVTLVADASLEAWCRRELVPRGIIVPAE